MRGLLGCFAVAGCLSAAVGCDGSSQTAASRACEADSCRGTDAGTPSFCHRWIDAFAHYMETCRCEGAAVQHFRDQNATSCDETAFFGSLSNPVAAGDLVYHPEAAALLFARLEAPDPECVE